MMSTVTVVSLAALLSLVSLDGVSQAATEITTCGQQIERGGAVLPADLDCSASPGPAVQIFKGRLDLNGFTITGSTIPSSGHPQPAVVYCSPGCRVKGPGSIVGGTYGVDGRRVMLRDLSISGAELFAVETTETLRMRDVEVTDSGVALGYPAIWAVGNRHKIRDSRIANNGAGIYAGGKTVVRGTTIENNVAAIGGVFRVTYGMRGGGKVRIKDSVVVGNTPLPEFGGPACDERGCVDLALAGARLKARNVTCETSIDLLSASETVPTTYASLGLCAHDGDIDQDGTPDGVDLCDYNPACSVVDGDSDLAGDCCDNCPGLANHDQVDADQDGVGNDCDPTPCPEYWPDCL